VTPSGSSGHDLESFILQLHRVSAQLLTFSAFNKHGISIAEWVLLKQLGSLPQRIMQISRKARISRQRASQLINRLEHKGLVRYVDAPNSNRKAGVVASESATAILADISDELAQVDLVTPKQLLPRLTRLLTRVGRSLRETTPRGRRHRNVERPLTDSGTDLDGVQ
jgi:DNA-binding MarR family transcriptional regulator